MKKAFSIRNIYYPFTNSLAKVQQIFYTALPSTQKYLNRAKYAPHFVDSILWRIFVNRLFLN